MKTRLFLGVLLPNPFHPFGVCRCRHEIKNDPLAISKIHPPGVRDIGPAPGNDEAVARYLDAMHIVISPE